MYIYTLYFFYLSIIIDVEFANIYALDDNNFLNFYFQL